MVDDDTRRSLNHFSLWRSSFSAFLFWCGHFRLFHYRCFAFRRFSSHLFSLFIFLFSIVFVVFRFIRLIVARVIVRRSVSSIAIGWWVVCWSITILIVVGPILVAVVVWAYIEINIERSTVILVTYKLNSSWIVFLSNSTKGFLLTEYLSRTYYKTINFLYFYKGRRIALLHIVEVDQFCISQCNMKDVVYSEARFSRNYITRI